MQAEDGYRISSRIRAAVARERLRISRELHDEFGAALTAMRLEVAAMLALQPPDPTSLQLRLQRLEGLLAHCTAARRELIRSLSAGPQSPAKLADSLRSLCLEAGAAARLEVRFEVTVEGAPELVPAPHAHAVFRLVQEALTNTLSHARARQSDVNLSIHGRGLLVVVCDDGVGFVVGVAPGHAGGLAGMRSRVLDLGGQWSIDSAPGGGTTVRAQLPFAGSLMEAGDDV